MDIALKYFDYTKNTLLVCLDSDCLISENYLTVLNDYRNKGIDAGYVPFTHRFTENEEENYAIICYDLFLHYYVAERKGQDGTWITDEMIKSYSTLHRYGKAKSIEVWENDELVGGLYGVDLGHIFCGESMFAKVSNASKAGFIYFVEKYKSQYQLIDCQVYTEHLASLGAKEIPKREFLKILKQNFSDENVK